MGNMGQPSPPNPQTGIGLGNEVAQGQQAYNTATAGQQYGFNLGTAGSQQAYNVGSQAGSQYNQSNPYGSLNYTQTGTGPNGVPIYSASESLSPIEQGLFNTYTGIQQTAGNQAGSLLGGANYGATSPTQAIGSMTSGLTNQMLGSEVSSLQPFFNIQNEQETAALANQGITPTGNPTAYNNAMLPFYAGQDTTVENFLANAEPSAFNQATSLYQEPATLSSQLLAESAPQSPNSSFTSNTPSLATTTVTPTTVQPTNLEQATSNEQTALNQQYQAQQAQYNAMISGMFGLGSSALGAITLGSLLG